MRIAWRFAAKYYLLTRNIVVSSPQFPGTAYKRKNSVMAQEIELKFIVAQDGVDALRSTSTRWRQSIRQRVNC
jgi:triphosphatase